MSEAARTHPAKYLLREMDGVAREFHRRLAADGRLCATRCEGCERVDFPPRARCPACGQGERWVELPRHGRLFAFTTQEAALRLPAPCVLALAEVGDVLVPGVAEAPYRDLRIGLPIEVAFRAEPDTGLTLIAFEPSRDT